MTIEISGRTLTCCAAALALCGCPGSANPLDGLSTGGSDGSTAGGTPSMTSAMSTITADGITASAGSEEGTTTGTATVSATGDVDGTTDGTTSTSGLSTGSSSDEGSSSSSDGGSSSSSDGGSSSSSGGGESSSSGGDECSAAIVDGGFEGGTPSAAWAESSTNFGTPLCDVAACGGVGGGTGPLTGDWWFWGGGIDGSDETAAVDQAVVIPVTAADLTFWLEIPVSDADGLDEITVDIDGNVLFTATDLDDATYANYTEVVLDVSMFADGALHNIQFTVSTTGGTSNFFVDDVSLVCG